MSAPDRPPVPVGRVDPTAAARYRREGWWGERTLADVVDGHARDRPEGVAFVSDAGTLTWSAYAAAADRLAAALVAVGLDAGERVAVLLPDGATVHVAFLANEKAGLVTVGLGSRAGDAEIRHLLAATGATALVTLAEHRGRDMTEVVAALRAGGLGLRHHVVVPRFESPGTEPVEVDGAAFAAPSGPAAEPSAGRRRGPDEVFMINSTSGTTGMPKCVLHHQNRWMYFHRMAVETGRLGPDDVFMGAVPAPFGFGLWTAHFTPTLLGAPTVVCERFDAATALELLARHRVSVLAAVSTQFIMMLNALDGRSVPLDALRVLYTGGEAVPYERARAFEARTGATVLQFYGSNESGLATGTRLDDPPEARLRTAGRRLPGTELRLFDAGVDVTATGRGQPGTRGPATCLGYLDDPAANAELFTDDGFVLHADVCTIDGEGWLRVVGRTSDLIIRGGKNISAGQVEEQVGRHPAVALVAALAVPDPVFGERVCVVVQLRPGRTLELDELVGFLRAAGVSPEQLPEQLVVVDELPRSSGGKVAKGELRAELARLDSRPAGSGR